ncbi:hypothetical protein BN1723_018969 [Verticillium longisporum]|uniref:Uncharacterized protein n=1 Tax=Verticillium longisporum TaxID=100787 RepID=A0A0G4LIW9_VERLO|nr:hypothetical protein BN1708_003539 [Verticillium longisporum]CRK42181.1 hypothetical protein BN1723_018969 [Verticillium longisporum]
MTHGQMKSVCNPVEHGSTPQSSLNGAPTMYFMRPVSRSFGVRSEATAVRGHSQVDMSRSHYPRSSVFAVAILGLRSSRLLVLALMRNRQQLSPTDLQGWKDVAARRWAMNRQDHGQSDLRIDGRYNRDQITNRLSISASSDQEPSIVTIPFLPANVLIRTRLLNAYHAGLGSPDMAPCPLPLSARLAKSRAQSASAATKQTSKRASRGGTTRAGSINTNKQHAPVGTGQCLPSIGLS